MNASRRLAPEKAPLLHFQIRSGGERFDERGTVSLQKLLLRGWVKAFPAISETGRAVREYRVTPSGRRQLERECADYRRMSTAIDAVLDTA